MWQNLLGKGIYSLLIFLSVIVIIYSISYFSPVDAARLTFGQNMSEEAVIAKKQQLGLDKSLVYQIVGYVADLSPIAFISKEKWERVPYKGMEIASFSNHIFCIKFPYLQQSYQSDRLVSSILADVIWNTVALAVLSMLLATVFGISMGILAAKHQNTWKDKIIIATSTLGYSTPSYITATLFAIVFGYLLKSYTGLNIQGSLWELDNLGEEIFVPKNIILPSLALGIRPMAIIVQLTRNAIIGELKKPYIDTAKMKALNSSVILRRHVLPNISIPIITALSGWFASLLAGAFFVEFVFNYRGLGFITINAILNYDIPLVLGAILVISFIFQIINLSLDFAYIYLDPRVKI